MSTTDTDRFNPFPGLRPFESEEDYLFFGREVQTDELLDRLRENRFLAVVGASGSGKSSLVRAGLLPALYGGFMLEDDSGWRVAMFRPGAHPIRSLAKALAKPEVFGHEDEELAAYQAIMLESTLQRGSLGLVEVFEQAQVSPKGNLLVVIDQFEELFRFKEYRSGSEVDDEAAAFVKLLLEASQSDQPVYVVLTMRSDFLGDCSQFRDLPETINAGQFLVPRMRRHQRQQAIEGPVAVGGAKITQRLVQRLLNDVGDNPDELPILQHALMRTWNKWEEEKTTDPIDLPHYEAIGGMAEALSRHGDEIYNELPDERSQQIAETLFKRLTDRSRDARGVRRPTSLKELTEVCQASREEVIAVIDAFREPGRSLLMPPKGTEMRDDTQIDISHESLMRVWRRLNDWVDEEAASAKMYERLAETAVLHSRGEAGLWRDPDLQMALEWKNTEIPLKSWADRYHEGFDVAMDFLEKSREQSIEEAREKEERQRRELEQEKKRTRRLRWTVTVMAVLFLIATAAAIFAYLQSNLNNRLTLQLEERNQALQDERDTSRRNEQNARDNERRANENERIAQEKEQEARAYADQIDSLYVELQDAFQAVTQSAEEAERSGAIAEARRIEAERQTLLAEQEAERANTATDLATQQLLQNLGVELSIKAIQEIDAGEIETGALLAREAHRFDQQSGSKFQNEIYDALRQSISALSSEAAVSRLIDHNGDGIRAIDYSVNGWIASGGDNGTIYVESPSGEYYLLDAHTDWIRKIAFNDDSSVLGTSSRDGTLKLWSIQEGTAPAPVALLDRFDQIAPIALDRRLLAAMNDLQAINTRLQTTLDDLADRLGDRIISVAYPQNQNGLVAGLGNGDLGLVGNVTDAGQDVVIAQAHRGGVFDIVFNPANTLLATAGATSDIQLRQWPHDAQIAYTSLKGHNAPINAIAFSPDGHTLVSASSDGTLRLWDLTDAGMGTIILEGHTSWVRAVAFSADGKSIVSGSADGTTRVWQIDEQYLVDLVCRLTTNNLSEEEWREFVEADIAYEEYYQPCPN